MDWWMMLSMIGLTSPAVPAAMLSPGQDGLTLDPLAITQTQTPQDGSAGAMFPEELAPQDAMSLTKQPLQVSPAPKKPAKSLSDDRSGFIYEPVYSTTGDRIQYQMGSGLGVGVTTDAALAISQSVRLGRGLDFSVYYAHPVNITPRDASLEPGNDPKTAIPAPSAGIRLEWKF